MASVPELSLLEATWRALLEVGRDETPAGVSALLLAAEIDKGGQSGSAMAALAKQHQSQLDEALKNAPRAEDRVDELRARRAKRLGVGA